MAMDVVGGVSRAPETAAVARVAANPYQNNVVRPDVSGQDLSPRQVSNQQYLERKIEERQQQRQQQVEETRDRIEISSEAKNAWQTGSYQRRLEQRSNPEVQAQQKQEFQLRQQTATTNREAQQERQSGNLLNLMA